MSKNIQKKLTLRRETIAPLDRAELDGVNGGFTPVISAVSVASLRFCRYTPAASQAVVAASKAVNWAIKNAPKGDPNNPPSFVGATA